MSTATLPSLPETPAGASDGRAPELGVASGSVSVGLGQRAAAQVWNAFKSEELRYVDILEMCAVLMCNVADKGQSTDHEIAHMTRRLMHDMRRTASSQNTELTDAHKNAP